jgi:hypothetical protein
MEGLIPGVLTLGGIDDEVVAVIAVVGGVSVAVIWVIAATIDSVFKTKSREQTRREIAAYVAEGTMTPEDAARILEAGKKMERGCAGSRVT